MLLELFSLVDNSTPMMVPNKMVYMGHDLRHLSEYYHIPIRGPSVCSNNRNIKYIQYYSYKNLVKNLTLH